MRGSLLSRVERLEEIIGATDKEHLLFIVRIGDGEEDFISAITDIRRGNSIQNDTKMPVGEFLDHVESVWDIDIKTDYHKDKGEPLRWTGDNQSTIVLN